MTPNMPSDEIKIPEVSCIGCGEILDSLGSTDKSVPEPIPGCPVVCLHCGAVSAYDTNGVRGFTPLEVLEIMGDHELMSQLLMMTDAVHFVRAARN